VHVSGLEKSGSASEEASFHPRFPWYSMIKGSLMFTLLAIVFLEESDSGVRQGHGKLSVVSRVSSRLIASHLISHRLAGSRGHARTHARTRRTVGCCFPSSHVHRMLI